MKIASKLVHKIAQELDSGMKVYLKKDTLEIKSSPYSQHWFDFKQKKYEEYVLEELEDQGFFIEKGIMKP